ncbi:hypothetical protein ACRAWF_25770 [Streptomyces sp. L7]
MIGAQTLHRGQTLDTGRGAHVPFATADGHCAQPAMHDVACGQVRRAPPG